MKNIYSLFNRKGQKIVGELTETKLSKKGVAVVQHGYSGTRQQKQIIALKQLYARLGFDVFTFDTTNSFGDSDGHIRDARLGLHAQDCEDVIHRVKQQDWFGGKLLLSGCSMGGYGVLLYASKFDADILIPISPVISGDLLHEAQKERDIDFYNKRKQDGVVVFESKSFPGQMKEQPRALMEEYLHHNILSQASTITIPTLLVVGSNDVTCRPKDVKQLSDALTCDNNDFVIIDGVGHTFRNNEELAKLDKVIEEWLHSFL